MSPYARIVAPIPPPSVSPATPVTRDLASRCGEAEGLSGTIDVGPRAPASTRARRASGSTVTSRISERVHYKPVVA